MIEIIRYLLAIALLIYSLFILKTKSSKLKKIKAIFCIFVCLIISIMPFENLFLKFDTPENALNYTMNDCEVVKIVEKSNTALIIYKKDNSLETTLVIKSNQKWKLPFWPNDISLLRFDENLLTIIIREKKSNNFYVLLSVNTNTKLITDNINSVFDEFSDSEIRNYYVTYVENCTGEYIIDIDGNKYQII